MLIGRWKIPAEPGLGTYLTDRRASRPAKARFPRERPRDAIFLGVSQTTFCHALVSRRSSNALFIKEAKNTVIKNVVQGSAKGAEGDGPAHQPHIPVPSKSLEGSGVAVRER